MNKGQLFIEGMSKHDFHQKVVRGVMRTHEFSKAVSFFVYNLTEDEKEILRKELSEIGLPSEYTMDDDDLDAIIGQIMDRAVHVR